MSTSTEVLTFAIGAGETRRFERGGRYLEVIEAGAAFDLYLSDASGARTEYAKNVVSGLFLQVAYGAIEVTSSTAQAITLMMTDGIAGTRRQPGTVAITNAISSSIQQRNATDTANAQAAGFQIAATIVTPAENTRGVRLRRYAVGVTGPAGVSAYTECRLMAAPSPPASFSEANALYIGGIRSTNAVPAGDGAAYLNVTIPPGWGIYSAVSNVGGVPSIVQRDLNFELIA